MIWVEVSRKFSKNPHFWQKSISTNFEIFESISTEVGSPLPKNISVSFSMSAFVKNYLPIWKLSENNVPVFRPFSTPSIRVALKWNLRLISKEVFSKLLLHHSAKVFKFTKLLFHYPKICLETEASAEERKSSACILTRLRTFSCSVGGTYNSKKLGRGSPQITSDSDALNEATYW